jgi:hypothetical protein
LRSGFYGEFLANGNNILAESDKQEHNSGGGSSDDEGERPWLPRWLSFLSGIPENRRKRRILIMVQAFVDDHGGKGQDIFLFSALIGEAEKWASISDEWEFWLKQPPSIRYFKMSEAVNLGGQFRRFSAKERDDKIKALCKVINTDELTEFSFVSEMEAFERRFKGAAKPLSEPYFFPFHSVIGGVSYNAAALGATQPIEIFFDENVIFGPRAKAWYPVVRVMFDDPVIRNIMPIEPFFRKDEDVLPLQAADLTAWMNGCEQRGDYGEFLWVPSHLSKIQYSPLSKVMGAEMLKQIFDGPVTPEMKANLEISKRMYEETFGHKWPPKTKEDRRKAKGREKRRK